MQKNNIIDSRELQTTSKEEKKFRKKVERRKKMHPLLLKFLSRKKKLEVEGVFDSSQTALIVGNHLCIDDIPTLAEAIKEHTYFLVSDEDKHTLNGIGLDANGVEWVTRTVKNSRLQASNHMVHNLKLGIVDYAMYPEATWNLSPNFLMLPMNYGCIRISNTAPVPTIPVVSSFTEEKRYTTIGKPRYFSDDLSSSIRDLRDEMALFVYNQIEKYYIDIDNKDKPSIYEMMVDGKPYYYEKRNDIDPYYWDDYVKKLYDAYPRAKKNPDEVREYESQFIFEPKTDDYAFFIIFNSSIRYDENGNMLIKRISSEKDGYNGTTCDEIDYGKFFGFGYNEVEYKKKIKKLDEERGK